MKFTLLAMLILCVYPSKFIQAAELPQAPVVPGDDLQAVLDQGRSLRLQPHRIYVLSRPLRFTTPYQRIATYDVNCPEDFATLQLAPGDASIIIDGNQQPGITIERVILDGNRYQMDPPDGTMPSLPLISLGKHGGDKQTIRQCVVLNSRSAGGWGAIHIHEGARGLQVEDNIVFGSGVDARGNGRMVKEKAFGWDDGISTASPNTLIRNNLIIDATDEGIMIQGAPGTHIIDNTVAAISREMLGGIALIDPFTDYPLDETIKRYDYRNVIVENNHIDAFGARIHIAFPMGGACWHQNLSGTTLVGAIVRNNTLTGHAAAYGFVANGIDGFTVIDNVSRAKHSGVGDGLPQDPPDPAAPFLFNPNSVGNSRLQPAFQPAKRHVIHRIRAFGQPTNELGYRVINNHARRQPFFKAY